MISSRGGLIAGVSPLKNVLDEASSGMGVATKATGLLSSTLGKAGLIGSIAAVGISLGALAYDQFQTANKTQKTVDSVKDLTKSMDELGKTVSASIPLMEMNFSKIGDFSSVLDSYQENIDMIMQKRQKLLEEKAKLEKDFFKPTWFGPSQAELAKSAYEADKAKAQADVLGLMEKEKKFVAEQHIKNILGSFLEKGVGTTFKELTGTDILLGESITSKVKSDLNKIEEIVKTTNKSFDEVAAAWGKQNGYMVAGIQVTEAEYINLMGVTNSYIKTLSNSTDEMDQNNKAFKEHIKLLKEIGELKKKTSLSYQKGLQRTLFESLVSGDLSLNDDTLEKIVGADRVKAVGYQAFSGYMNKKTREIRMNLELVQAADWLYTQTEVLGSLVEALRGTAPDDPMRGQLLSMIDLTRKGIETSKFGRNIASSYDLSTNLGKAATSILSNYKELGQVRAMSLAQFLQSPSATSKSVTLGGKWSEGTALFNAWQKYGGENLTGQQAKDFWEKWMPKTSIPTNVGGISKALSRSSLSGSMYSTVSKYSGSLTASRGTSGRRRGGGGFHGRGGYTQDQINAVVAAYTGGLVSRRQSLLDSISNVVNLLAPLQQFGVFIDSSELQDIPQVPGFTWKWEGIRTMDLMEYAKNVYQPMAQQFYSALSNKESIFSSEFTRVFSSVGVTSYNDLMTQLANPLTSDDVENTLRFNARLEQISTGATVL